MGTQNVELKPPEQIMSFFFNSFFVSAFSFVAELLITIKSNKLIQGGIMLKTDLNNLDLNEFIARDNPGQRCKATFPMFAAHGTKDSATVYFEIDSGEELGMHTDSAEELLLIIEGSIEAIVGDEKGEASEGTLLLVPKMAPHNFRNIGDGKAKVLGFFGGANNIVATFENTWLPTESNVVDTSKLIEETEKV